jgi:hypothetical protein
MSEPDLQPSEPLKGDCNATDGFSVCTEAPGHGPTHWDRRTRHEWSDENPPAEWKPDRRDLEDWS